jgi:hypothetical protein
MSLGMNCIKTVFYTLLGHQQTLLYGHFNWPQIYSESLDYFEIQAKRIGNDTTHGRS